VIGVLFVRSTAGGDDRMHQGVFGLIGVLATGTACTETYSFRAATEANRYDQAVANSLSTGQPGNQTVRQSQIA
jgi:hypothetical protein